MGSKSAEIEIASDDPDEDPYVISLTGTGTNTLPGAPGLAFPDDGLTNVSAEEVTFIWDEAVDDDGDTLSYTFYLGTTDDLSGVTGVQVAAGTPSVMLPAGLSVGLLAVIGGALRTRRLRVVAALLIVLCAVCLTLGACRGTVPVDNPEPGAGQKSHTVTDLLAATTYYWKVAASDGYGDSVASEVQSFTTQ